MSVNPAIERQVPEYRVTSFTMYPEGDRVLEQRAASPGGGRHGDRSSVLNRILMRYDAICQHEVPAWSKARWGLVIRALGTQPLGDDVAIFALPDVVRAGLARIGEADQALVDELERLNYGQRLAVIDRVERFRRDAEVEA